MTSATIETTAATRGRKVLHRLTTGLVAFAFVAIGAADLVRAPAITAGLVHLGYPTYVATILGAWKILGAAAIVAPGFPRLKEWAYAGMAFDLTGAAMSHAAVGDALPEVLVPLAILGLAAASWALRPAPEGAAAAGAPTVASRVGAPRAR